MPIVPQNDVRIRTLLSSSVAITVHSALDNVHVCTLFSLLYHTFYFLSSVSYNLLREQSLGGLKPPTSLYCFYIAFLFASGLPTKFQATDVTSIIQVRVLYQLSYKPTVVSVLFPVSSEMVSSDVGVSEIALWTPRCSVMFSMF